MMATTSENPASEPQLVKKTRQGSTFPRRWGSLRSASQRSICSSEANAGDVDVNAAAVVSAVTAYARINSRGELIERTQTVNLNSLFERMSAEELDRYARDGSLPDWFETVVATGAHGRVASSEE
jgi:hypothetical protein